MTAPKVVCKIVEINPVMKYLLFVIYTSTKNLEEEPVIQIRTSIDRMIFHNAPKEKEKIWLVREDIQIEHLNNIINSLATGRALAVTSIVKTPNLEVTLHIPMMDFNCEASPENLEKIQEFLKKIGQKGVVLVSGRSYHYYGVELLSEKDLLIFLGKCLLFVDFTDPRYIGHRLQDGHLNLRISKEIRRPDLPKVVATV